MMVMKSKRKMTGISTLVATVLILTVVVTLVSIVATWATGYLDIILGRSGVMVTIENVEFSNSTEPIGDRIIVTIMNKGVSETEIKAVYIDGTETPEDTWSMTVGTTANMTTIKPDQIGKITINKTWEPKTSYTIKIVMSGYFQVTKTVTSPEKK